MRAYNILQEMRDYTMSSFPGINFPHIRYGKYTLQGSISEGDDITRVLLSNSSPPVDIRHRMNTCTINL